MASRILVVYYSRTGHTEQLAARIAASLGADLEAISDPTRRRGVLGFLRSAYEAIRERQPPIAPSTLNVASYPIVVLGTPIWSNSMASPVRSYLARHRGALRSVAFFCTYGGSGGDRAFARMARASGRPAVSTLAVRASELDRANAEIERFLSEVRAATEAPHAPRPAPGETPTFA